MPGDGTTYQVLGIPLSRHDVQSASEAVLASAGQPRSLAVHLCNSYTMSLAKHSGPLRDALTTSDLNLPDGVPVALLGRSVGVTVGVRGPDLFRCVIDKGRSSGVRHFLFGGLPGVADLVAGSLRSAYPGCDIVHAWTPGSGMPTEDAVDELLTAVEESKTDVLWIGLGTPNQDLLVAVLAARCSAVLIPVGAAFDFVAGTVKESPPALRRGGLEGVYRFTREPRRLWKRYCINTPQFLASAAAEKFAGRRR